MTVRTGALARLAAEPGQATEPGAVLPGGRDIARTRPRSIPRTE